MAQASVALDSARTYLNDIAKQIWSDNALLPYLKEAYRDLVLGVTINGLDLLKEKSSVIAQPVYPAAGYGTLALPADFYEPISLKERATGSTSLDDFVDMEVMEWEPDTAPNTSLKVWALRNGAIHFIGATTARDVLIRYVGGLSVPTSTNSELILQLAETFLGPQTAGYAAASLGNDTLAAKLQYIPDVNLGIAGGKLSQIIRINVKQGQSLPARRKGYHRGRVRGI